MTITEIASAVVLAVLAAIFIERLKKVKRKEAGREQGLSTFKFRAEIEMSTARARENQGQPVTRSQNSQSPISKEG